MGQAKQQREEQMKEQRRVILKAILSPEARQRLSNLKMVKEDRAFQVENMLIQQSQSGMINGKVSENHVKMILDQLSEKEAKKKTSVTIDRKKMSTIQTNPISIIYGRTMIDWICAVFILSTFINTVLRKLSCFAFNNALVSDHA